MTLDGYMERRTSEAVAEIKEEQGISRFPGWPFFEEDETRAVMEVLRSGKVNYWTGQEGRLFEKEFAEFTGCTHAIALSNGTIALELALKALGIGPGDDVIVPCRTFIASASCVVAMGARPVMADIDLSSQNITVETIEAAITPATKAIVAVHLAGWPCDMDPIMEFAAKRGIKVVEDCAQAHGATYKGRPVGSLGHIAAFSFCQDKIMTTGGEGGMVTTNDRSLWAKVWALKDHGKNHDACYATKSGSGFRWLHDSFGTNGRMTEMQAAIGRLQLKKLPRWTEKRRRHAGILSDAFSKMPALRTVVPPAEIGHAYYKYYAFLRDGLLKDGWSRDRILESIVAGGVPCFSGSCSEIYLEKAFVDAGYHARARLEHAKELGETSLMFLVHPTLEDKNLFDTCMVVGKVLRMATE